MYNDELILKKVLKYVGIVTGIIVGVMLTLVLIVLLCHTTYAVVAQQWCNDMESIHPELTFHYGFWTDCRIRTPNGKYIIASDYLQYYGDLNTILIGEVGD
jgi:hypothetical protein